MKKFKQKHIYINTTKTKKIQLFVINKNNNNLFTQKHKFT